jgi:hypothetical protein
MDAVLMCVRDASLVCGLCVVAVLWLLRVRTAGCAAQQGGQMIGRGRVEA